MTSVAEKSGVSKSSNEADGWTALLAIRHRDDQATSRKNDRRRRIEALKNGDIELTGNTNTSVHLENSVKNSALSEFDLMRLLDRDINFPASIGEIVKPVIVDETVKCIFGKLASAGLINLSDEMVMSINYAKISAILRETHEQGDLEEVPQKIDRRDAIADEVGMLLAKPTAREKALVLERCSGFAEISRLLLCQSAMQKLTSEKIKADNRNHPGVEKFCEFGTRYECRRYNGFAASRACQRLHFRRVIKRHTDESLGDCSFLNTCFHMDTCKYVHYEIEHAPTKRSSTTPAATTTSNILDSIQVPCPPQWIQCDIRYLDVSVLGKFSVIMADPPWDIHMELPYGTMSDDEMRRLNIPALQDEGFFFLWVTGRAMELGRQCLKCWGYERVDELLWVKTNQLQRLIRTGRTGHWLNHGKEHCIIGYKGKKLSAGVNFKIGLESDVIVSEVRETSRKPDEIYGLIERLSPGTRKLELFGRPHNLMPYWLTLGNQLDGVCLHEPEMVARYRKRFPNGIPSASLTTTASAVTVTGTPNLGLEI